jgi:hypothetical protein
MSNDKIAKELMSIAKELVASVKVERTFRRDRDGYEEVDIEVTVNDIHHMAVGQFLALMDKYSTQVVRERSKVISKYKLRTDPLNPVHVEVSGGDIVISGGFATDVGVLPREELRRNGFKEVN